MSDSIDVFELIETVPNSKDWLEKRKGRVGVAVGSSAMGAAAGISPYKSRNEVVRELVYGSKFKGNDATAHGHKYEALCASRWSAITQIKSFEVGICRPTANNPKFNAKCQPGYPYFGVSVDRWACATCKDPVPDMRKHVSCKGFKVIECKCPFSQRSFENSYDRKIKDEHLAQIHLQMAVIGIREIDYMVALISSKGYVQQERLATVRFSDEFWDWIYPKALEVALVSVSSLWSGKEPELVEEMGEMPPRVSVNWHR